MKQKGIWGAGIPTRQDVEKLMQINFSAGDSIGFGQVETIIGEQRTSNRFRTVTAAWRKRLFRERGIRTKAEGGVFAVLTATQSLSESVRGINAVKRKASRELVYVRSIDVRNLSRADQDRQMLLSRHAAALLGHADEVTRAIAPPSPIKK